MEFVLPGEAPDVVPPHEAPDEYDIAISAQITTAKDEILLPIRIWLHFKLVILFAILFAAYMTQTEKLNLIDYYVISFSPLVFTFYSCPEIGLHIYILLNSANKFTQRIQYFVDGWVSIFAVSF